MTDAVGQPIRSDGEYLMAHKGVNFGWYGGVKDGRFFLVHDWGDAYVVNGKCLLSKTNWEDRWSAILLQDVADVVENHPEMISDVMIREQHFPITSRRDTKDLGK